MSQHPSKPPITEEHLADLLASRSNTSPVPILKHKAENSVRRQLKDVAIKGCAFHVRALAECTDGKLISVIWHCRHLSKAIDSCMRQFGDDELLKDEMRRRFVTFLISVFCTSFLCHVRFFLRLLLFDGWFLMMWLDMVLSSHRLLRDIDSLPLLPRNKICLHSCNCITLVFDNLSDKHVPQNESQCILKRSAVYFYYLHAAKLL